MKGAKFSSGRYALGICDRCGLRFRLHDLRGETIRGRARNNMVCDSCYDPDHPQDFLDQAVTVDPMALQYARPQIDLAASRRMIPFNMWLNGQRPTLPQQEVLLMNQV